MTEEEVNKWLEVFFEKGLARMVPRPDGEIGLVVTEKGEKQAEEFEQWLRASGVVHQINRHYRQK